MGLRETLFGRSKPVAANLDALFALPSAALTLEASSGFRPTGTGSVCFRPAEGGAFHSAESEATDLLSAGGTRSIRQVTDEYGYVWVVVDGDAADLSALVVDLHGVNTTLVDAGFTSTLLCTVVGFTGEISGASRQLALVYLFKQGTFYPFAPLDGQRRDNQLELTVRAQLGSDLPVEQDLARWFPVWGAPGLS